MVWQEQTPADPETLEAAELEQIAAADSKPGGTGDGRGLLDDRREAP